jgi:hypothetical protein
MRTISVYPWDDAEKYIIDVGEDANGDPEEATSVSPEEWENMKGDKSLFPITVDDDEWEEIKRQMEAIDD